MITISTKGYNVAKIGISETLTLETATEVGKAEDFDKLLMFSKNGYLILRCKFNVDDELVVFDGSVDCNVCDDIIEFSVVTYDGNDPDGGDAMLLGGQLYLDGDDIKIYVTYNEIGGSSPAPAPEYVELNVTQATAMKTCLANLYALIDTSKLTDDSHIHVKITGAGTVDSSITRCKFEKISAKITPTGDFSCIKGDGTIVPGSSQQSTFTVTYTMYIRISNSASTCNLLISKCVVDLTGNATYICNDESDKTFIGTLRFYY